MIHTYTSAGNARLWLRPVTAEFVLRYSSRGESGVDLTGISTVIHPSSQGQCCTQASTRMMTIGPNPRYRSGCMVLTFKALNVFANLTETLPTPSLQRFAWWGFGNKEITRGTHAEKGYLNLCATSENTFVTTISRNTVSVQLP